MGQEKQIVVCDTNVLISAVGWNGPERRVYTLVRNRRLTLAVSPALLDELRRVLAYPKLGFSPEEAAAFAADVEGRAVVVRPAVTVELINDDPDDNRVLECAEAAGAHRILSGDKHLLRLGRFETIPILTAREFLDTVDA